MNLLPFQLLPSYRPRRSLPADLNPGDWNSIAPLFDVLEQRAANCLRTQEFESWLIDWGELLAALDEEGSKRYIAMTCYTENKEAEAAYLNFIEQVEPAVKPRHFKLAQIYIAHPLRRELSGARYAVFDRSTAVQVELYRPENVPLETEESKIGQQYQKLAGSLTVRFQGQERTLVEMARFLEETDRQVREEAWRMVSRRRLEEADRFEDLFDQLVGLRSRIAANAGYASYLEYAFRLRGRFDYTPEDCLAFHLAIEEEVIPLLKKLQLRRKEELGLEVLRPWDLAVDPLNRPPLRPFADVPEMVRKTEEIFAKLDEVWASRFRAMRELKLLDLDNRKGKAPGGYQSTLAESRLPFIFMNAVGIHRDVETLLHEAGHAFHALAARDEELYAYRNAPIEFCEVASMSMELLGNQYLEEFYTPADAQRARRTHYESLISFFPWMAMVDAFQHWIYLHPSHNRLERRAAWEALTSRFEGAVDWSGLETERAFLWHRQLHIFLHPFYYVEYGIAQLGALQIWALAKKDKSSALRSYERALQLGGSRPLPELFQTAGCQFDFSRQILRPLMELVCEQVTDATQRVPTGRKHKEH